jgi:hypothetical protein
VVERLDECVPRHLEPAAQIVPDRDAEFVAGLDQAQKGVAAVAADLAPRPGTDLAPGDVAADIVLPKPRVFGGHRLTVVSCGKAAVVCTEMGDSLGYDTPREIAHGPGAVPDLAVLCD